MINKMKKVFSFFQDSFTQESLRSFSVLPFLECCWRKRKTFTLQYYHDRIQANGKRNENLW